MTTVAGSGRSTRSSNGAQQAMFSAGRGLFLILLAIAIGIVLLYVVDDGSTGPANTAAATSTTAAASSGVTASTARGSATTASSATRPPGEVRIKVYNAGKPTGSASKMTDQLRTRGYTNALGASDLKPVQTGTSVACRPGYAGADAAALAAAVGSNAKVVAWPSPDPPQVGDANCIIILGT